MNVKFKDLWVGDRFFAYGSLWTKMPGNTARQHSQRSIDLGSQGHGFLMDTICTFAPDEIVEFQPPQGKTE